MSEYHKINTIYKRDMASPKKTLIEGDWSAPEFECLANAAWQFTEKVDGTNIRVVLSGDSVSFGGRTDNAQIPAKLFARLQELFPADKVRGAFEPSVNAVLYGEGYGASIQKAGGNYGPIDFVLFDVRVGPQWWLRRDAVDDIARKLGVRSVPVIGEGTLLDAVAMAKAGIKSTWGDFESEGIVARPKAELLTRSGHRIVAKVKCRDFAAGSLA